jgi:hypothetical protein
MGKVTTYEPDAVFYLKKPAQMSAGFLQIPIFERMYCSIWSLIIMQKIDAIAFILQA